MPFWTDLASSGCCITYGMGGEAAGSRREESPMSFDGEEEEDDVSSECRRLLPSLPRERYYCHGVSLYQYQGFWLPSIIIDSILSCQRHFEAGDGDVLLVSPPNSGTTWLKALAFSVTDRGHSSPQQSPLLTSNPHDLVRFLELDIYFRKTECPVSLPVPRPTMFATHIPYPLLPSSVKDSKCRIVYICRNPLDRFVSFWHFANSMGPAQPLDPDSLDHGLEMLSRGVELFGPWWDHALGYWEMRRERAEKVMFLKYEDLNEDVTSHVKGLADFLGVPFSEEEERDGIVEEISRLCSLEMNKTGNRPCGVKNTAHFRDGGVGGWTNYVSPSMAERIRTVMEEKLRGSGLSFKMSIN